MLLNKICCLTEYKNFSWDFSALKHVYFSLFPAASVEFDLAAIMGRQAGKTQCDTIYARCPYESKDIMEVMRSEF